MQEGANPIVIRKKNERKKLVSGQKLKIETGDILELIPGHYFFKYVTITREKNETSTPTRQKRRLDEENASCSKDHAFGKKKTRDVSEEVFFFLISDVFFLMFEVFVGFEGKRLIMGQH